MAVVSLAKRHESVRVLCMGLALVAGACGSLTGVDKYDFNDCPKGDCSQVDGASSGGLDGGDGAPFDDGSTGSDGSLTDVAVDTFSCPTGTSLVTLTVTQQGSVSSNPVGLQGITSSNSPASACLPLGTVVLRSNGNKGSWTGVTCKDGNQDTDRCEFINTAAGASVTATLQN
jgi:hypothetical protein